MAAARPSSSIDRTLNPPAVTKVGLNPYGYISVALGIILLIGSMAVTGVLYAQHARDAFLWGGSMAAVGILSLVLTRYYGYTSQRQTREPIIPGPTPVQAPEPLVATAPDKPIPVALTVVEQFNKDPTSVSLESLLELETRELQKLDLTKFTADQLVIFILQWI